MVNRGKHHVLFGTAIAPRPAGSALLDARASGRHHCSETELLEQRGWGFTLLPGFDVQAVERLDFGRFPWPQDRPAMGLVSWVHFHFSSVRSKLKNQCIQKHSSINSIEHELLLNLSLSEIRGPSNPIGFQSFLVSNLKSCIITPLFFLCCCCSFCSSPAVLAEATWWWIGWTGIQITMWWVARSSWCIPVWHRWTILVMENWGGHFLKRTFMSYWNWSHWSPYLDYLGLFIYLYLFFDLHKSHPCLCRMDNQCCLSRPSRYCRLGSAEVQSGCQRIGLHRPQHQSSRASWPRYGELAKAKGNGNGVLSCWAAHQR